MSQEPLPRFAETEIEFSVRDIVSCVDGEPVRSSTKVVGNFRFRLLIYPGGTAVEPDCVSAFVEVDPLDSWDPMWVYHGVQYQITCIHHVDHGKSITLDDISSFSKDNPRGGWGMVQQRELTPESGWLGPDGALRFRASVVVPQESNDANAPKATRVCRFCFGAEDEDDNIDDFVEPCTCRGSGKSVHLHCLVQHYMARGEWHNFKCPTCQHIYEGAALLTLAELSRERMIDEYGQKTLPVAHSLSYLAQAQGQLGHARKSKELLEECLDIEQYHFGSDHVATSSTLAELATAHGRLGNMQQQKALLERSLNIREKHFGAGHISTAVTLNNLATVYSELGDLLKERELLERSLQIKDSHLGKGHVQSAATLVNLAGVYSELGDAEEGRKLLKHCLAIEEQHFGEGHAETAITLNNLALACGETGDPTEMRKLLEKSLAIKERSFGVDHVETSLTLGNLGMAWALVEGSAAQSKSFVSRALRACEAGAANSRRHGVVLLRAAAVDAALGEAASSEALATEALRMLVDALGAAAGARVLAQERDRTARIWSAAGFADVGRWHAAFSVAERLPEREKQQEKHQDGTDEPATSFWPTW